MLDFHPSLQVALIIKSIMDLEALDKDVGRILVHAYSNCREQGLHFSGFLGRVSVSQARGSDRIVVYAGRSMTDFEVTGWIPTDKTWENRTYFDPGEYGKAARFILDYITQEGD